MQKHIMLGVNGDRCCLLRCLIPFEGLIGAELEVSDFWHAATDTGGSDTLCRTLALKALEMTGREIVLDKPLYFRGQDADCGHMFSWTFPVLKICEVEVQEP